MPLNYFLILTVPEVSLIINGSGSTPTLSSNYSLFCVASGIEELNPTVTYQWFQYNSTKMEVGSNSSSLSFTALSLSNAGNYTCVITVNSSYLDQPFCVSSESFSVYFQGILN